MWFFPWGILTRYENLNGEMMMNHGNGEGQPIFRRQPANGLSSCGLKSSYGKQTLQILGIPMFATEMICKWIFSKFVEKIHWHLELSCIYIYICIYIYTYRVLLQRLWMCVLLFQPPIVVASCGHCSFVHQVGWTPLQPHPGPKELLYGNFAPWPRWQARPGSGEVWCRLSTEIGWISIKWVLRHGSVGL